MASTEKTISSLIKTQLPDFVRADHPKFKRFLELYYQWLETNDSDGVSNTAGNTIYQAMNIDSYRDIDQTPDDFLRFFKQELLPYFPETTALDIRKILKSAREFYSKKGSVESVKWLFKVLFDEDIEINYPKEQILKTSDGKWKLPKAFRITVGETSKNIDVNLLEKRLVVGVDSGATCIVESANRTIDSNNGKEVIEIYISNIKRYFNNGEYIKINYTDANGVDKVFSEKIIGTISNIYLDSNIKTDPQQKRRGLLYNVGDPVVITGGLASTAEATHAVAIVGNVSAGSIEAVTSIFPGYGYRLYSNTEVIVLRSTGDDPDANAETDLRVTALNVTSNTSNSQRNFIEAITYDKSVIDYLGETVISAADFAFFTGNNFNAVINVTENDAADYYENYEIVWANGTNYYDALFTAKIATANTGPFAQGGSPVTAGLLLYDIANTGPLATILSGQDIIAANSGKVFAYNSITTYPVPANVNSQLLQCFKFITVNTGGIALISVTNGGAGFRAPPILRVTSEYDTILSENYTYGTTNQNDTVQTFKDLGLIAHVYINNGGTGYANGDTITFSGRGYGGNANVTVNAAGSITSINLIDRGEGHIIRPEAIVNRASPTYSVATGTASVQTGSKIVVGSGTAFVEQFSTKNVIKINGEARRVALITNSTHLIVNSAFNTTATSQTVYKQNGEEASLTAYLFGDGYTYEVETSIIGRIKDIKLIYRGYDYIARPNVSLKVLDTVIDAIPEYEDFIEEEYIFQGGSLSTSTFSANVKSYDRTTNVLRLYDFSGNFDPTISLTSANGVTCTVNVSANVPAPSQYTSGVIATGLPNPMKYGDGRAKAIATFANGLIQFNGFYLNSDGFVSSDQVLQDGHIYHNFSYVIQSSKDLAEYQTSLKNIAHPSGLIAISKKVMSVEKSSGLIEFPSVDYINPPNTSSNVQISNSYSNVVTGNNTAFLEDSHKVNVGDLFIITDTGNPLRSISKIVSEVDSNTQLKVYGDFIYVGQGKANTNSSNTWLSVTGATNAISDFIQNGDQVRVNLISVIVDGKVGVTGTSVTSHDTHFVGNVVVGTEVSVNNEIRRVTTVTDNLNLVVNSAFTSAATNKPISVVGDRTLTGTVSVTAACTDIVGVSTSFVGNVTAGIAISVNNQIRNVTTVTSGTQLVVDAPFTYSGSGNTIIRKETARTLDGVVDVSGTAIVRHPTHFVGNVVVGSQITVNNETRIVTTVTNDTSLVVNSAFAHAATDKYMVANSVIVKTVSSVSGNNIIMNSAYFVTKTNLVYQVVPNYSSQDYSYKIITLTAN